MSKIVRGIAGIAAIALGVIFEPLAPYLLPLGASLLIGAVLEKKPDDVSRLQTQSVMVRSAVKAQEIIYGRDKKSGLVTYFDTSGTTNEFLWFVITIAEHEIDGYETLYIDDVAIDLSTEIDGSGYVTNSAFIDADGNKLVKTAFYLGVSSQTADAELVAAFADWTVNHNGNDCAYFWVRCELDRSAGGTDPDNPEANVWSKGYPQEISVVVRGKKVYDPRLDSTNGGTGTHRADDSSTWEWSENSVLCRTDYLRSSRFGPGYLSSEVIWSVVAAQADVADALVSIPGSETQKRYTLNGVVTVDGTPKSILESMQSADHGTTLFLADGLQILVGAWEASSHTIDSTWLAGGFSASSATATDDAYNAVRGQFVSAADDYALVEFPPVLAPAYETEDGVGRVWQDILLPFTRESYAAQRLGIIEVKKSRQQTNVSLLCNFRGELVQLYQVVTIDLPGYDNETFRVLGKASSTDGTVTLTLREEVSTDWTYDIPDLAEPPVIPSVVRYPDGVPAPTALAAVTAPGGIRLQAAHPSMTDISHLEFYVASSNDRSGATLLERALAEQTFHALDEDEVRYYWVIARGYNGMLSQWYPVSATGGVSGTAGAADAGENAIIGFLTNEAHIVPADADGTNYDLTGSGGTFFVFDGTADVTGAGPVYKVLDGGGNPVSNYTANGLNMAIDVGTGVYTLSDDTEWVAPGDNLGNLYTLRATYGGVTIDKHYTIIKALAGADGSEAKLINIIFSSQEFKYDTDGVLTSASSIDFSAYQYGSTETIVWVTQRWSGSAWVNTTINRVSPTTGITTTLTEAAFAAEGEVVLRVMGYFFDGGVYYIDAVTVVKVQDGAAGADAVRYYIKPTNGTAIKNSAGTLTVEAHKVTGGVDEHLSSGTIGLYVGNTLVTVANGYATGSDGYTGVFDAGDISGSVPVLLKDSGSLSVIIDSITLVDVTDGDGNSAVYGYIEPSNGLAYVQAQDGGAWNTTAPTDLDCTFVQGGSEIARLSRRVSLDTGDGTLDVTTTTHPGGDLTTNTSVLVTGDTTNRVSIRFTYDDGTDVVKVTEEVMVVRGGSEGSPGADGSDGSDGADGVSVQLTNASPNIATESDGTGYAQTSSPETYTIVGGGGTCQVVEGGTDITTGNGVAYTLNEAGVAGTTTKYVTKNGLTFVINATTGVYWVRSPSSDSAWTSDSETFIVRATYGGVNYDRQYTITKVKAGGVGSVAGDVDLVSVSANAGAGGTTTQGFRLDSDGTVDATTVTSGVYANQYTWLNNGLNSDYEVKMTKVSGLSLTSGTLDTWLSCDTDRTWVRTASTGAWVGQLTIRNATSGAILDTCTVELDNVTA